MTAAKQQQFAVPDYVDEAGQTSPNDTWAIVPRATTGFDEGWQHLTYRDLAAAVNNLAWWIEEKIGVAQRPGQAIGYMGANDLRYLVVLAATLKAGYVPLFTSPRNSLDGQRHVLEKTGCEIFMSSAETAKQVDGIREAIPHLRTVQVPKIREILEMKSSVTTYKGRHSRDVDAHSLILHTSGSTGLPKPIYLTVGGLNTVHAQASLADEEGFEQITKVFFADRRPLLVIAPLFHAMGILVGLRSLMCKGTIVRTPSEKMLSADLVVDAIESSKATFGIMPPSILEDVAATDRGIEALGKLEYVFFGGAPLATAAGEKICKVTKLVTCIGSTEALLISGLLPSEPEEWLYFHWSSVAGVDMEPAEDGLHELVLKRKDLKFQGIFHTFSELQEFRTKDLFRRHATKPYLWKYIGRRDDIIVLSNGEKFNPVSTEKLIESHPLVKGALVVGTGRFQAGLLVEPEWNRLGSYDPSALIEQIWPTVEQANREAPSHARIYQSKIAVAKVQKPFVRAGKGSIIRSQTVAAFKDEIEALYADEGYSSDLNTTSDGEADLTGQIHGLFSHFLPSFQKDTPDGVDIFSLGVDSLDVLALTNAINKAVPGANVNAPLIYSNPSVKQLAEVLSQNTKKRVDQPAAPLSREEKMDRMVRKYTTDMVRQKCPKNSSERPSKHTVVLTGSTGSLGTHILEQLLQDPKVEKVYCMNRSDNAEARQKDSFRKNHHDATNFNKAEFLKTDFAVDQFGLSDGIYKQLLDTVTIFIHSAWSVDFNLSLDSYEATHIAGTRRAASFAAASTHTAALIFISSIASVGAWSSLVPDGSPVPETTTSLFDAALTLPQGYGESKYVASQILAVASHRLGIPVAIVRAGQLAGPTAKAGGAAWNRHEWLPTLVHTSKVLGKLPRTLGSHDGVDWVPMDVAAGGVIDISYATGATPDAELTQVYHLTNPHTTTWSKLYPVIQHFYKDAGVELEVKEYGAWVEELKGMERTKENAERVPGLKLVEFYEGLKGGMGSPALETGRTEACSRTVKEGRAVDGEVLGKWLGQWAF
ncbi:acetyl-CoA synthetase-like protein [Bimuria novae-zelandiae CBS 107.79]|uniref:Acetyl-CoA synthetase-like protein n=1 Tax=Bimuria novae-zelandiae CBS 107.79 TaxID=1447943 RepID=A0A6A5VLN5_9PLEO|nr:acetyl-CoA synthetase-like protein [Bimuria novae-zelandiae CBS 107.79]